MKKYKDLNKNEINYIIFPDDYIRIDKVNKEKLKITTNSNSHIIRNGSSSWDIFEKYVKTNLSPKQYYLQVYKKNLENENKTKKFVIVK